MPLWGKLNQAVTANSTTTRETTQGAPMNLSGYVSGKSGFSRFPAGPNGAFGNTSPGSMASIDAALFQNTTSSALLYQRVIGVFGVTANQMTYQTTNKLPDQPAHSGWVMRRAGTGPIIKFGYTGTATGYSNTDVLLATSPSGSANNNAYGTISTNSTGGALVLSIGNNAGRDFNSVNNAVTVANSTGGASSGTGATFYATAGGRAGRVHNETLVAMGSIVPGVNNTIYTANT